MGINIQNNIFKITTKTKNKNWNDFVATFNEMAQMQASKICCLSTTKLKLPFFIKQFIIFFKKGD